MLGPSVMGRIPGFTDAIFPSDSIPVLSNVANLGLILFLFLVGLEVDLRLFLSNWRSAVSVGIAGMALPFGLGCAISWGLYNEFSGEPGTEPVAFGTYLLFIGIAMAITVCLAVNKWSMPLLTIRRRFPCCVESLQSSSYSQRPSA